MKGPFRLTVALLPYALYCYGVITYMSGILGAKHPVRCNDGATEFSVGYLSDRYRLGELQVLRPEGLKSEWRAEL